jgi:hypothetical protein
MSEISVKPGDTLLLQMTFQNDDGSGADLTNVTLLSQVRDPVGNLIAVLPITKTSVLNVATVDVDTTGWPGGLLRCDIRAVSAGFRDMSETFGIRVNRAVTQ